MKVIQFVFKYKNNTLPSFYNEYFTDLDKVHECITEQDKNLVYSLLSTKILMKLHKNCLKLI